MREPCRPSQHVGDRIGHSPNLACQEVRVSEQALTSAVNNVGGVSVLQGRFIANKGLRPVASIYYSITNANLVYSNNIANHDMSRDLAIIVLAKGFEFSQNDLPAGPMKVWVGSHDPLGLDSPNATARMTGWSNNTDAGGIGNTLYQANPGVAQKSCHPLGYFLPWCSADYIQVDSDSDSDNNGRAHPGDSGSPLTVQMMNRDNRLDTWIIGVDSHGNCTSTNNDDCTSIYSPTFDNGGGNAQWLIDHLPDTDGDGVWDIEDNCPASACVRMGIPFTKCANADQADHDGDGVGDVCDNCRAVPNRSQGDRDHDNVGDACDSCPSMKGSPPAGPNGFGDICDTCPGITRNLQEGCLVGDKNACHSSATDFCVQGAYTSYCAEQPDYDHDGVANACDTCWNVFNPRHQTNSNGFAEVDVSAAAQGDVCDPVPVVRLDQQPRVVQLGKPILPSDTLDLAGFSFVGSSVGEPTDMAATDPAKIKQELHSATFVACGCYDPATETPYDDLDTCKNFCGWHATDLSASGSVWRPITTEITGSIVPPGGSKLFPFSNSVDCASILPASYTGASRPLDDCSLGFTIPKVRWDYFADYTRASSGFGALYDPASKRRSPALVWSAVVGTTDVGRDSDTSGQLRNYLAYADPTATVFDFSNFPNTIPAGYFDPRKIPPPGGIPVFEPSRFSGYPAGMRPINGPLAVAALGGRALGATATDSGLMDLSPLLSPGVVSLLGDPQNMMLTAAEPLIQSFGARTAPIAVSFPRNWTGSASVRLLVASANGIALSDEFQQQRGPQIATLSNEVDLNAPAPRQAVFGVYSRSEQSVYLIGGTPRGSIKRYDLADQSWHPVSAKAQLPNGSTVDVRPENVLAATYDWKAQRLLFVEEQQRTVGKSSVPRTTAILVSVDTTTGRTTEVAVLPRKPGSTGVFLNVLADGSYALSWTELRTTPKSFVQRFVLTAASVKWRGRTSLDGAIASAPASTAYGLAAPTIAGSSLAVRTVSLSQLAERDEDCDDL
jgi:hypothetical protein